MGLRGRLGIALLALWLVTCSVNPVTGRREIVLMSAEREATLGKQAAAQVESEIGLVDDRDLVTYIGAIGQRLAVHSPRRDVSYRFAVADMPEPNAFALPGGYIYVSRGLLALANSEAELANVIGHEIGHVAARHSAQRETSQLGVGLLSVIGVIAAGAAGGGSAAEAAAQLGQVAGAGLIASYGRSQERQSDEVGQTLAAQAGWDPRGMSDFLASLDRESTRVAGGPRRPSFLDSHPVTSERVASTRQRATQLRVEPGAPIAGDRSAFLSRIEGLLVGENPARGVFQDEHFLHLGLDFGIAFPEGWQTVNQQSAVIGLAPSRDAAVVLELGGPPADPAEAAAAFAQQNQLTLIGGTRGSSQGLPIYRARAEAQGQQGPMALDLTWIQHPRATFQVTGMSAPAAFTSHAPRFQRVAESFHRLTSRERESVRELRLGLARAQRGETVSALSRRTGNVWSLEETLVANALERDATLAAGTVVKIAVARPYRP